MAIERVVIDGRPAGRLRIDARLRSDEGSGELAVSDVTLTNESGRVVALVEGLVFKRASRELVGQSRSARIAAWLHTLDWQVAARPPQPATADDPIGWLIINAAPELGDLLAARLHASTVRCILPGPGIHPRGEQAGPALAPAGRPARR